MSKQNECRAKNPATCKTHGTPPASFPANPAANDVQKFKEELQRSLKNTEQPSLSFRDDGPFRNVRKMNALFVIDRVKHEGTEEINERAAWIFDEPAQATIKHDGTSITVDEDGNVYARRSVKKGKTPPPGFVHAETDPVTGHMFGLEPMEQSGFKKMFKEAAGDQKLTTGTYELCGPKVNGNPERLDAHSLIPHGSVVAEGIPDMRTVPKSEAYATLKAIFTKYKEQGIEGVVWAGSNGKRTKLRVKDFFGDDFR